MVFAVWRIVMTKRIQQIAMCGWSLSLGLGLALVLMGTAVAQQAGTWSVRAGWIQVSPSVVSGDLTPSAISGVQADIANSLRFGGGINYMVDDHWAVDIPLAAPFRHDIVGAGSAAGVGKLADVRSLPITVLAQYRLGMPQANWRPYVGLGLTYARFDQVNPTAAVGALTGNPQTTMSVDPRWGTSWQVGSQWKLNDRWFVYSSATKTFVSTRAVLSTGETLNMHVDPWSFAAGLGYQF
jgi:outer membrane protein